MHRSLQDLIAIPGCEITSCMTTVDKLMPLPVWRNSIAYNQGCSIRLQSAHRDDEIGLSLGKPVSAGIASEGASHDCTLMTIVAFGSADSRQNMKSLLMKSHVVGA